MNKKLKPVIITTEYKGVFFGYAKKTDGKTITLTNARMCVYWSSNVKGILGLAATGPLSGCKITPSVPSITLQKVTSCIECSPEAAKAWEKDMWS